VGRGLLACAPVSVDVGAWKLRGRYRKWCYVLFQGNLYSCLERERNDVSHRWMLIDGRFPDERELPGCFGVKFGGSWDPTRLA